MINRLYSVVNNVIWRIKYQFNLTPTAGNETLARLSWLTSSQPRFTSGRFLFPFGVIKYIDNLSLRYQYLDIFIKRIYDFKSDHPSPNIIDCGGNIGLSVIRFKQLFPKSTIKVYEADPSIFNTMKSNLEEYYMEDIKLTNAAVWNNNAQVIFNNDGADSGRIDVGGKGIIIDSVKLSDSINNTIDLLKIDAEGAEFEILLDLCNNGKLKHIKRIISEVHCDKNNRECLSEFINIISSSGFSYTISDVKCNKSVFGSQESTPFVFADGGSFLFNLYAWRD